MCADLLEDGSWRVNEGLSSTYEYFGQSTAMVDDLLLVGSPREFARGDGEGQAVLYQFSDGDWHRIQSFSDSASWSFGTTVDMDAQRIVISSPAESNGTGDFGAVYVYVQGATKWELDGVVQAGAGSYLGQFGLAVSLDGSFLAVGEPAWDESSGGNEGRAHIWRLGANGAYAQLQTVEPDQSERGRGFGWSLELEGDVLAVGGPSIYGGAIDDGGRAWIFRKNGDYYEQDARLEAPAPMVDEQELFGYSIALDGTRVAIGRPGKDLDATHPSHGSVHLYLDDGTSWLHEQEMIADELGAQRLGTSVDVSAGRVVAGMPGDGGYGADSGAVAIFERTKVEWEQAARISAMDGQERAEFGHSVCMSGERVAVGAPSFDGETSIRAAYIYDSTDGWQQQPEGTVVPTLFADASIDPVTPVDGAAFGYRVAHDGDWGIAVELPVESGSLGRVSFLHRSGSEWSVVQVDDLDDLVPSGSGGSLASVAIDQNWAIVGLGMPVKFGNVLLYTRDGSGTWTLEHVFANPIPSDDTFGATVDLNRNNERVVVGSPGADPNGVVHTYALVNSTWVLETISPDDRGEGGGGTPSQFFGQGLEFLGGNWLAIGAPGESDLVGKVYICNFSGGTWNQFQVIDDPGLPLRGAGGTSMFGYSISLNFDGYLFIGAPSQSLFGEGTAGAGCVHVFEYDSVQNAFLPADFIMSADPRGGSMFGWDLDRSGDMLVISEPFADDLALNTGRIWLYEKIQVGSGRGKGGSDEPQWIRTAKLVSNEPLQADLLGYTVSLAGASLLSNSNNGGGVDSMSGRIKVFDTPFMSFWNRPSGGSIDDVGAWLPEPPSVSRGAVFSTWGGAGYDLYLDETSDMTSIRIGLDQVRAVPAEDGSTFGTKADPVSFFVGCPPDMSQSTAALSGGELTINGDISLGSDELAGTVRLEDAAKLNINGTWAQASRGRLSMTVYEGMTSRLEISDTPQLAGTLSVQGSVAGLEVGAVLPLIDSGLESGGLSSGFELALLPGLPDNRCFLLHQGGGSRGSTVVWLEVIDLADLIAFDDDDPYAVGDGATAVLTADLNSDDYEEIVVVLGGSPGSLVIFNNDGAGGFASQDVYALGNDPAGLASGDFDGDGDIDLAASNFTDNTVDIFRNDGTGMFVPDGTPLAVGAGPLGLGARDLDLDGLDDLLVCCSEEREIQTYLGLSLRGTREAQKVDTDGKPSSIDPADYDKEKSGDVGATTTEPGMILTMSVNGSGELGEPQGHPSGPKPSNIKGKDVDGDGEGDFVASDEEEGTVTVLKKSSSTRGYDPPLVITVAASTGSLTLFDFDVDGDEDIAVVATLDDGSRVAKMLRNDSDLYGGSLLVFADAEDLATDVDVLLLSSGDLDHDGDDDLVVIGERDLRGGRGLASTLGVYDNPRCVGDTDGDQVVDVSDLLDVISNWGACNGCTCDFNLDGMVDVMDLLEVIGSWGLCAK
ncbi:MAG: FG-GAP-like repeat-containing protein [Phycisphaerales bacterium]|nr:FG-GAP-like repeat-containing protein [Phycisphaerales bacterium]